MLAVLLRWEAGEETQQPTPLPLRGRQPAWELGESARLAAEPAAATPGRALRTWLGRDHATADPRARNSPVCSRVIELMAALVLRVVSNMLLPTVAVAAAAGSPGLPTPTALSGALESVLPPLSPRLAKLGIDGATLSSCLHALPADARDDILLGAAVRSGALDHALLALEAARQAEGSGHQCPSPKLLAALLSNIDPSYGSSPEQQPSLSSATTSLVQLDALLGECTPLGAEPRAHAAAAMSLVAAGSPLLSIADLERALPSVLREVDAIVRASVGPAWSEEEVHVVACDAVVSELLDAHDDDDDGEPGDSSPLASESVASFLKWLRDDVEAADLEEWRQDTGRLYGFVDDDDVLPGLDVAVTEAGAGVIMRAALGGDDDTDKWFDNDLDEDEGQL